MAEWLGSALQKLLQRFESASDLIDQMESPVVTATAGLLCFRVLTRVPTPQRGFGPNWDNGICARQMSFTLCPERNGQTCLSLLPHPFV